MKTNTKRMLIVAVWLAAFCLCMALADQLTRRDDSARKYNAFFEDEQGFDVLFFGTSRVLDGVQPVELWRDYGFTSYNLGNNSEPLGMTERVMETAFKTHKPKAAVIDVYYVDKRLDEEWTYSFRHLFLDALRLSPEKIEIVTKTLPKNMWMEFLVPFSLYHGRWEEILSGTAQRMVDCEPFMMGAELRSAREMYIEGFTRTQEMTQETLPGHDALRRIVKICRENGVEPVFTAIWAPLSEEEQRIVNSVQRVAEEMGVPFVNMLDTENLFDYRTDCCDFQGHLNPDGAAKATAYLGRWLTEHIDLPDRRGDAAYAHWDENLRAYEAYRAQVWDEETEAYLARREEVLREAGLLD